MSATIRRVRGMVIAPPHYGDMPHHLLRMTIPAREALERAGNDVTMAPSSPVGSPLAWCPRYAVILRGRIPAGLVLCLIGHGDEQHRGLRLRDEEPYPGEWSDGGIAWYERGAWLPCPAPRCGRALVWYEGGYVPGYRVCTRGHHAQLSMDGRRVVSVREGEQHRIPPSIGEED